jgi:hypothetical protein
VTAGGGIRFVEKAVAYLASDQGPQSIELALECFKELSISQPFAFDSLIVTSWALRVHSHLAEQVSSLVRVSE